MALGSIDPFEIVVFIINVVSYFFCSSGIIISIISLIKIHRNKELKGKFYAIFGLILNILIFIYSILVFIIMLMPTNI